MNAFKPTSIVAVVAVALATACSDTPVQPESSEVADPSAQMASAHSIPSVGSADVHPIVGGAPDFTTDVGDSRLIRGRNGIDVLLQTTGLRPGHTYTLWAVIFNGGDPSAPFDAVRFVAGFIAGKSGGAVFAGRVQANDGGGELFGELTDPMGAEVHLIVRCHGPATPEFLPEQINSFAGGCTPESSGGLGNGPYICKDVQVAIHPAGM